MKNLIEELQWRGLVHDAMPGTEEQLFLWEYLTQIITNLHKLIRDNL